MAKEPVKPQPSRIGKKSVSVFLPVTKWRALKMIAVANDTTMDKLLRHGVELVLTEYEKPK